MSRETEIVKSASARVNLGNWQHVDYFVSMKAVLDGEEKPSEIIDAGKRLQWLCNDLLLIDLREHFKTRGKIITDTQIRKQFGIANFKPLAPEEFG